MSHKATSLSCWLVQHPSSEKDSRQAGMTDNSAIIMSLCIVKPHKQSFLQKQESRKTKENTGFPLKNCGNDGKSIVLLLMVFIVIFHSSNLFRPTRSGT